MRARAGRPLRAGLRPAAAVACTCLVRPPARPRPPPCPLPPPRCTCSSKDVIEPVLKPQWWVNCQDMAAQGCAAVRDGRLEIIPREFEATWFRCARAPYALVDRLLGGRCGQAGRAGWLGSGRRRVYCRRVCTCVSVPLAHLPRPTPHTQVDGEHPGLVHLAAAVVGAPNPSLLRAAGGCARLHSFARTLHVGAPTMSVPARPTPRSSTPRPHPARAPGEDAGMPGAPSERMDHWVVGRDADEAEAAARERFPGQAFKIMQARCWLGGALVARHA